MLKSMGPDITASTQVGCTEKSKVCVESTKSISGHTKTSIEIRLKQFEFTFIWCVLLVYEEDCGGCLTVKNWWELLTGDDGVCFTWFPFDRLGEPHI